MKGLLTVHIFLAITLTRAADIRPYLQAPQPTSIYVCWQWQDDTSSVVDFGMTSELGQSRSGSSEWIGGSVRWHSVLLDGLDEDTRYYYVCRSGQARSDTFSFRTPPGLGTNAGHIRFALVSDNQDFPDVSAWVFGQLKQKITELYGSDVEQHINLVFDTGDIVGDGWSISQYREQFFDPVSPLSANVPFMISIGNHEGDSDYFWAHMKYEDLAGPEGEKYYSFQLGRVLFIALNSNWAMQNEMQMDWLRSVLDQANRDETIDWIFTFCHHPGHSEVWPDGNTPYVQDRVIPLLSQYSKARLLTYGHTHAYERGAVTDGLLRLMLRASAGGALDRWRMYDNQTDYPEIQKSIDHYGYSLIDIDVPARRLTCRSYSLGHTDKPLQNVLIDSFSIALDDTAKPAAPRPQQEISNGTLPAIISGGAYSGPGKLHSTQFQLTDRAGDYSVPILDIKRDYENVYLDSGAPDWQPTDRNAGLDISRLELTTEQLPEAGNYFWHVRYRAANLQWSDWSVEKTLEITDSGFEPLKVRNKALDFDGKSAYVQIADELSSAKLPERELTVETWVNLREYSAWGGFVSVIQDNGGYEKGWFLGNQNGSFTFGLSSQGADDGDGRLTMLSSKQFKTDTWYHLAATYDGQIMRLFINGREQKKSTAQSGDILYDPQSFFDIGAYHDLNEFYPINGQLDEIRLWDQALPDSVIRDWMHQEITDQHPYYSDLISYWNINDNVSGREFMDSRQQNTGSLQNMNITDVKISTAPLGMVSACIEDTSRHVIGPAGSGMKVQIISKPSDRHYLGAYYSGNGGGQMIDFEEFPQGITRRFDLLWGAVEYGHGVIFGEDVLANFTFSYGGIVTGGAQDSMRLISRPDAMAPWQDITAEAIQDKENTCFHLNGQTDILAEYSLAFATGLVGIPSEQGSVVREFKLGALYPNPFNAVCSIPLTLPVSASVDLRVFNIQGQQITQLVEGIMPAGKHLVRWDASRVGSGVYYIRFSAGRHQKVIKGLLIK